MSVVFGVFFSDGGFEVDGAAGFVGDLAAGADGDDFGGAFRFEPQADGLTEDGIGALAGELRLGEEQVKLIQRQGDRDGTHHLFFHPGGDGVHITFPFVDGGGAAITEPFGKLFACHAALLAEVAEGLRSHFSVFHSQFSVPPCAVR